MDHYQVFMTKSANDDLKAILSYIHYELKEPAIAIKLVEKIKNSVMSLAKFPYRYNLVANEQLATQGFRKIIIDSYIVFYIVSETKQTVTVVRILYSKRDWLHLL
ncbi:MAG TPA: type II toxin-antitoxin system RelE/ParE family toxin [Bacillota bacterium]|nr:type II toxin-antitoxin system RelE/ParE family toxin [Bacillota bacterium]HOL10475.1 type II toxin-antitoxin system RelE/ParE family toxin [Bacillota bacterium]HPO98176.1 type II toxin-antitoxin system RelE/ParE family toxin [Bacillota bacterium]